MAVGELSCSVLMVVGGEATSIMPSPVCGTLVFIMCLCKCFIQSSCTDKGPWKTRSQNLRRGEQMSMTKYARQSPICVTCVFATRNFLIFFLIRRVSELYLQVSLYISSGVCGKGSVFFFEPGLERGLTALQSKAGRGEFVLVEKGI